MRRTDWARSRGTLAPAPAGGLPLGHQASFPFREVCLAKNASRLRHTARRERAWGRKAADHPPLSRHHAGSGSIKDGPSSCGDETRGDMG